MAGLRVAVCSNNDVFAAGIQQILAHTNELEVLRVRGNLASLRRHLPLHAVVLDSDAFERVNLQKILALTDQPGVRVICVELSANQARVYERGLADIRRANDLTALLLPSTGGSDVSRAGSGPEGQRP